MTTLLHSTFTGTNGAPWPSPWLGGLVGGSTGGAVDIQSNRGRLRASDTSWSTARAHADGISGESFEITATVRFPSVAEQYHNIWFRSNGGWSSASPWNRINGYYFYMGMGYGGNNEIIIRKIVNDTSVAIDGGYSTLASPFQANIDYSIKIRADGTLLRAKMWVAANAEPDWQISVTDNTFTSGTFATSLLRGGSTAAREAQYDTFTVEDLVEGEFGASNWTAYIQATTAIDPATPHKQFFTYNGTELVPVDMYVGGP